MCLNHVIDLIHPVLGDKILSVWEFPEQLAALPSLAQDLERCTDKVDYVDIVQIARALSDGSEHALGRLPALRHLNLPAFVY